MRKATRLALILLFLGSAIALRSDRFLTTENLQNLGRQIGLHGILALALGTVIVAGGIDLSGGSVVAISGLIFALTAPSGGAATGIICALLTGALAGGIQGLLIAKARLQPFIVTLCGLLILRGVSRFLTEDESRGLGDVRIQLAPLVEGKILGVPTPFLLLLGLGVVLGVVLHASVLGRHLFAMGSNEEASRLAGVPIERLKVFVYALAGTLAAFSGILFVIYTNALQPANSGKGYELYAIAAAVLGGVSLRGGSGTVLGMIIGCAVIRVLVNGTTLLKVPTYLDDAVVGTAILLGVLIDEVSRRGFRGGGRGGGAAARSQS